MEELKEFKDRLRKARIEKNISQVELGRLTGASQSKIAALESGRNKKPTNIIELSEILGVSAYWLETGKGDMHASIPPHQDEIKNIHRPMLWSSTDPLPEDDYTFAPYMKEQAFCGGAGSFEIPDYNGFRLPFGKATLRRKSISPDKVFCCTLTGDSMEERIAEDAAIAVDAGEKTIRDGKIYAFRHGDLFRVKYLSRLPGGRVKIKSHNPAYEDEEAGLEDIEVIGRVFWWSVLD